MEVMEVVPDIFARKNGETLILQETMALQPSLGIKTRFFYAMQKFCCPGQNVKYVPVMFQEQWLILKLVRDRAWGGTAPAVIKDSANYDGTPGVAITDPLQMVLSEYRHELTGEYSLFYNLCRAGDAEAIAFIKKANGTVDASYEPVVNPAPGPTHDGKKHGLYNTTPTVNNLLLPIPQSAIALNPNLTQNPGY